MFILSPLGHHIMKGRFIIKKLIRILFIPILVVLLSSFAGLNVTANEPSEIEEIVNSYFYERNAFLSSETDTINVTVVPIKNDELDHRNALLENE